MVSEPSQSGGLCAPSSVLILVLVEDGLGVYLSALSIVLYAVVLILVLVEDGLGALKSRRYETLREVLILVLVEDGLGGPATKM